MITNTHQILVGGISVDVVRKDIKNLHLAVYPPKGRVRVAVPLHVGDEQIRLVVVSRLGWIRRRQKGFLDQDRQSAREMVSGETHYFQGRRYRLGVVRDSIRSGVRISKPGTIELLSHDGVGVNKRFMILQEWYRSVLRERIGPLIKKWEPVVGASVEDWGIRRMKTRWGTCNQEARRIWVNLELAKKPPECLEYIIVHEMVHLLEPQHGERFARIMNHALPKWRFLREVLNRAPLSHENWKY
jgi:predicted metal-dependent hydrolase